MMRVVLLLLCLSCINTFSQKKEPFHFNKRTSISLSAFGLVSAGSGYFLKNRINPLSVQQIEMSDKNDIPFFDRKAIYYQSNTALHISNIGQYMSLAFPLGVLAFRPSKKELITQLIMVQEVIGITYGLTSITKGLTQRSSPYVYNPRIDLEKKRDAEARTSFFSGHTSITAALSFYTASVIAAYSDNTSLKTMAWVGAFTFPAVVAYVRVRSGEHFYSDVVVAYLVGASIGYIVPKLHRKKTEQRVSIAPVFAPNQSSVYVNYHF